MSSGPFASSRQVTAIPPVDPRQWPPPPRPAACTCVSMETPLCLLPGPPWSGPLVSSSLWVWGRRPPPPLQTPRPMATLEGQAAPPPTPWCLSRPACGFPRHAAPSPPFPERSLGPGVWKGRAQPLPFPPRAPSPSSDCVSPCGTWRAQHFRRSCGVLPLLSLSCPEPGTQGPTHPGQGPEGSIVGQGTAARGT